MPKARPKNKTPLTLNKMTTAAKIRTMELLWEDLCRKSDEISSPIWHHEVLAEREFVVLSGESTIDDWETAKVKIKELVS